MDRVAYSEEELLSSIAYDEPLIANHPEIPAALALQGFHAVRAFAADPERSRPLLEDTLGFSEPSAFFRAHKRWTGLTPVESRARLRAEGH